MEHLSKDFWSSRYQNESTGWDLGNVSPPIKVYFDQIEDKSLRILIPGCGNGHEAEYLFNHGFVNVHVVDLAEEPLLSLKSRVPSFPESHLHLDDFFEHEGSYDFIIEQTMFCAIDPKLRQSYANKAIELLAKGGMIVGVLFNRDFEVGPPYGGSKEEYLGYFSQFESVKMDDCYNSALPRQGSELFVQIGK